MPIKIVTNGILAAWAVFFSWLISFGQDHLARLLHPRLWWLLICGALILALFLVANLRRTSTPRGRISLWWRWPSFLILLVPILYFVPMQNARFNSRTFAGRALQTDTGFYQQEIAGIPAEDSAIDATSSEVSLTRLYADSGKYMGKEVEVVCQDLQDQRLPDDLMLCYRFRINCCAADAQPVFIFVRKAEGGALVDNDTWTRVRGRLSLYQKGDISIPLITAETITTEKEPSVPFIF